MVTCRERSYRADRKYLLEAQEFVSTDDRGSEPEQFLGGRARYRLAAVLFNAAVFLTDTGIKERTR